MSRGLLLVVDDDRDIREALAEVLEDEGYEVAGAANGQEALDQLAKGLKPTAILLDLMMPVMDGYEFHARWAADPELKKIPVVVITAGRTTTERPKPAGALAVLTKPLALETLLQVLGGVAP